MRIADKMNYEQVKSNLAKNRSDMSQLQNQAATQKRVTKPSDDPLAAARVLAARTEISGNTQFLKSINVARSFLEYSEQSLNELSDTLIRAKELAVSQSSDASADAKTRTVTAAEVEQLIGQAVQIGNRKLGDRFLFGGFRTTQAPFDIHGNYEGDEGEMRITINKEASVPMNIPGSQVFLGLNTHALKGAQQDKAPELPKQDATPRQNLQDNPNNQVPMRGPASISQAFETEVEAQQGPKRDGVNIFRVLQNFEVALRTNDKAGVQDSLDQIDSAIEQVVLTRSKLGARVMTLNSGSESLQKGQVDAKTMASNLEDADTFELVSDINKTESTLKASLATSGKLIQPSLLDFLR